MHKMNTLFVTEHFQQNSNTHSINNFYSDFPKYKIIMKNQIKNRKIEFSNLKQTTSNCNLPNKPHQIILGSLMGDMFCRRENLNSKIEETHSINQKDYLIWKCSILKNYLRIHLYNINNSIFKDKNKTYVRKAQIRLRSRVAEKLNKYHSMFYPNGKKIVNQEVLDQLDTLGISVWYCDDGHYDKENHTAELHTEGFSIEENQILKKWFNERWSINANFKRDHSKKKVLLRFPVKETNKFLNLVKGHIFDMPKSVWYKLGHIWEGNQKSLNRAKINKLTRTKIYQSKENVKIRRNHQSKEFYKKNKGKILKEKAKYRKTKRYKAYIREYHQRLGVKEKMTENLRRYRQKPEYKAKVLNYRREYRKRPEIKEKIIEYNEKYRERKKGDKN